MPFPLVKHPRGLLGAFEMKTLGQAPPQFGDTVLPTTDVTELYIPQLKIVQKDITCTNPAVFAEDTWDVPAGKVWRWWGVALTGTLAAADTALTVQTIFSVNDGSNQIALQAMAGTGGTNPSLKRSGANWRPTPLFLPAGYGVYAGFFLSAAPAVAFTMTFSVAYHEYEL